MKLTKTKLKQIIKEELTSFQGMGDIEAFSDEPELEEKLPILDAIAQLLAGWTSEEPDAVNYHTQLDQLYQGYKPEGCG